MNQRGLLSGGKIIQSVGRCRSALFLACTFLTSAFVAFPVCAEDSKGLEFKFAGASEREPLVADQLRALSRRFDLGPWLFTRKIRVEAGVIPHSHPVLTLHTRHLDNPDQLLATFLHEQIHWFLAGLSNNDSLEAAFEELKEMYPEVPKPAEGGAANEESTYRHLVVNWLEFDAMESLVGQEKARQVIRDKDYYEWIYAQVLADDVELGSLIRRHRLLINHEEE